MPLVAKVSGAWKSASAVAVRVGGAWKTATPYIRVGGVWKSAALAKVATPTIGMVTFPGAPSDMTAQVRLTCATDGATIWTSVNNGAWTVFSSVVLVPPGQTLRTYATEAGMADSDILGPTTF